MASSGFLFAAEFIRFVDTGRGKSRFRILLSPQKFDTAVSPVESADKMRAMQKAGFHHLQLRPRRQIAYVAGKCTFLVGPRRITSPDTTSCIIRRGELRQRRLRKPQHLPFDRFAPARSLINFPQRNSACRRAADVRCDPRPVVCTSRDPAQLQSA